MPSHVSLKTYQKKGKRLSSLENFDKLFAKNIFQRKQTQAWKKHFNVKQLPPAKSNHFTDDSFHVQINDTFDRLHNGTNYNSVIWKSKANNCTSESDASKSNSWQTAPITNTFHTPVIVKPTTRLNKRNLGKRLKKESPLVCSIKQRTLDQSVDYSLCIEKETKPKDLLSFYFLSSTPVIVQSDKSLKPYNYNFTCSKEKSNIGNSSMISSTPIVPFLPHLVNSISPIGTGSLQQKILEESYQEIKDWSFKYPVVENKQVSSISETPKRACYKHKRNLRSTIRKSKYFLRNHRKKLDVKFHLEPKVMLERIVDVIGIENSVLVNVSSPKFQGFSVDSTSHANNIFKKITDYSTSSKIINSIERLKEKVESFADSYQIATEVIQLDTNNIKSIKINEKSDDITNTDLTLMDKIALINITQANFENFYEDRIIDVPFDNMDKAMEKEGKSSNVKIDLSSKELLVLVPDVDLNDLGEHIEILTHNVESATKTDSKVQVENEKSDNIKTDLILNAEEAVVILNESDNTEKLGNNEQTDLKKTDLKLCCEEETMKQTTPSVQMTDVNTDNSLKLSTNCRKSSLVPSQNYAVEDIIIEIFDTDEESDDDAAHQNVNESMNCSQEDLFNSSTNEICIDISFDQIDNCDEMIQKECRNGDNGIVSESSSTNIVKHMSSITVSTPSVCEEENQSDSVDNSVIDLVSDSEENSSQSQIATPVLKISHVSSRKLDYKPSKKSLNLNLSNIAPFEQELNLIPGKMWRRSLLMKRCLQREGCTCTKCKEENLDATAVIPSRCQRMSIKIVPLSTEKVSRLSILENYAVTLTTPGAEVIVERSYCEHFMHNCYKDSDLWPAICMCLTPYVVPSDCESVDFNDPSLENSFNKLSLNNSNADIIPVSARDVVLRRCGQTAPTSFEKCYPNSMLKNCHKIGEGVYGEVFIFRNSSGTTSVMKIIPIEGNIIINGERQKKFDEILSEIVITMELSNLKFNKENQTEGFAQLDKVHCVQGKYPSRLIYLWELYNEDHNSENDSPEVFGDDQLYIILELGNGGKDLEAYVFNNAKQSLLLFKQLVFTLAVAEEELEFEHRDLHWGNVLISTVERNKKLKYSLGGTDVEVDTDGVQLTIIDYTLSRITHDGVCIFNDLAVDPELFTAKGDYQFDIYRLMKEHNCNQWQNFEPFTNILWLDYILDKMVTALRYRNVSSKAHKTCLEKMEHLRENILNYNSCFELAIAIINFKFDNF